MRPAVHLYHAVPEVDSNNITATEQNIYRSASILSSTERVNSCVVALPPMSRVIALPEPITS
jgi:hypothetical protein